MESEDRELKGTENTGLLWIFIYFMAALAFVALAGNAWVAFDSQPFRWKTVVNFGFKFIVFPVPMMMGISFRGTLKRELDKDLLGERTYRICDLWIAKLLALVYLGLMAIQM